jgi:hypothetical protein
MPTLLREGSFRVVVYTNGHRPAHVHVQGGGGEAVFELHCTGVCRSFVASDITS